MFEFTPMEKTSRKEIGRAKRSSKQVLALMAGVSLAACSNTALPKAKATVSSHETQFTPSKIDYAFNGVAIFSPGTNVATPDKGNVVLTTPLAVENPVISGPTDKGVDITSGQYTASWSGRTTGEVYSATIDNDPKHPTELWTHQYEPVSVLVNANTSSIEEVIKYGLNPLHPDEPIGFELNCNTMSECETITQNIAGAPYLK